MLWIFSGSMWSGSVILPSKMKGHWRVISLFCYACMHTYRHAYLYRPSRHKCSCPKMTWCSPASVQKLCCYIGCQRHWDNHPSFSSVSLCWQHRRLWIKTLQCWASLDWQNTNSSLFLWDIINIFPRLLEVKDSKYTINEVWTVWKKWK